MVSPDTVALLQQMAVPDEEAIYILGCFDRRVTVYSQQVRALNLVHALLDAGVLGPDKKLALVGGGVAGLTAGAAALTEQCHVTVFEQSDRLIPLQAGCTKRWIHPRIYDWPHADALNSSADLPFLSWEAGTPHEVVQKLLGEWRAIQAQHADRCKVLLQTQATGATAKTLSWNDLATKTSQRRGYDAIIFAVGFGVEREEPGVFSYWRDDDLEQTVLGPQRRYLVSGCGDGGLTDLLRIRLKTFELPRLIKTLADSSFDNLRERISKIEETAISKTTPQAINRVISDEYDRLRESVDAEIPLRVLGDLRTDTEATLNGRDPSPWSIQSSALNRMLSALLAPPYIVGEMSPDRPIVSGKYRVRFSSGHEEDFDRLVIRHGPTPALDRGQLRALYSRCKGRLSAVGTLDLTRRRLFDDRWKPRSRAARAAFSSAQSAGSDRDPEPSPSPTDGFVLQTSVDDYLASLRDYCASLPYLSLHDIRPAKTLSETYVALRARDTRSKATGHEKQGRATSNEFLIADVIKDSKEGRIVILGEPGAGKSSLLRHLAERSWASYESIGLAKPHLPLLVTLPQLAAASGTLERRLSAILEQELALTYDLPNNFFAEWPRRVGADWLLLFDALDEVPGKTRAQFVRWLNGALRKLSPNRFVITTRTSGYRDDELQVAALKQYEILPFAPEQISEFAHRWFKADAKSFLDKFDRTNTGDLQHTPLLLAIAAKVFLEGRDLSERRSRLYESFVSITLSEAEQKGILGEMDERVWKMARLVIGHIALFLTKQPTASEHAIHGAIAEYFQHALRISVDESIVDAKQFLSTMARRSGLIGRRGESVVFIHPTIQEYLAAEAILHECKWETEELWTRYLSRWRKRQWREVVLFVLGNLSEHGTDVNHIFGRILPTLAADKLVRALELYGERAAAGLLNPNGALSFATEAIRDGVAVDKDHQEQVAECYLTVINHLDREDLLQISETGSSPFSALRLLRPTTSVVNGLRDIAINEEFDGYFRFRALETLVRIRKTTSDIRLLLEWGLRPEEIYEHDGDSQFQLQLDIAELLARIGEQRKAMEVISSLIRDPDVLEHGEDILIETWVEMVGDRRANARAAEDLHAIALNRRVSALAFDRVLETIATRKPKWATSVLKEIATDSSVDDWRRCDAAITLAFLGQHTVARGLLLRLAEEIDDSYARYYAESKARNI